MEKITVRLMKAGTCWSTTLLSFHLLPCVTGTCDVPVPTHSLAFWFFQKLHFTQCTHTATGSAIKSLALHSTCWSWNILGLLPSLSWWSDPTVRATSCSDCKLSIKVTHTHSGMRSAGTQRKEQTPPYKRLSTHMGWTGQRETSWNICKELKTTTWYSTLYLEN